MFRVFGLISTVIGIYSFLCIIRIFMSWMPELLFSKFGNFMRQICDPFLDLFRRLPFTQVGMIDISPIFALGALSILQMIFNNLSVGRLVSPLVIFVMIIHVIWSFISFMIVLVMIMLVIRLIYEFVSHNSYSGFWVSLDTFLMPLIARISKIFVPNKQLSVRNGLILSLAVIFTVWLVLRFLIALLL